MGCEILPFSVGFRDFLFLEEISRASRKLKRTGDRVVNVILTRKVVKLKKGKPICRRFCVAISHFVDLPKEICSHAI